MFDFHFCESLCSVLMKDTISTKVLKTPNLFFFFFLKLHKKQQLAWGYLKIMRCGQWHKIAVTVLQELFQMQKKHPTLCSKPSVSS